MAEKKRRQGQKKTDGTIATPKQVCSKCGEYLKMAGGRNGRAWRRIGQYCPNPACDYIVKDLVDLTGETESMNELEND